MNYKRIQPRPLQGTLTIPPSKSMSHRALICAALASGESSIANLALSDDVLATINGIEAFGARVLSKTEGPDHYTLTVKGSAPLKPVNRWIDCGESGSTLRFLIPLAGLVTGEMGYTGRGKLVERPLDIYYQIFAEQQIDYFNDNGKLPLTVNGRLKPGTFSIAGNISSQFITGLMLALPLLTGNSRIELTTELESRGYVDLTLDILRQFNVEVVNVDYQQFTIKGNQRYHSWFYRVEGDYSQAAFWLTAGLLGNGIKCRGLEIDSRQGDRAILKIIREMGGRLNIEEDFASTEQSTTRGLTLDASQFPDLVPIIATLAAVSEGTTRIFNASRLRIKESDRLKSISTELNKIGADITELEDGLIVNGQRELTGGVVDSWNDHRIAMALAIASIKCTKPLIITGSGAVNKSYPSFWEDFISLGGKIDE